MDFRNLGQSISPAANNCISHGFGPSPWEIAHSSLIQFPPGMHSRSFEQPACTSSQQSKPPVRQLSSPSHQSELPRADDCDQYFQDFRDHHVVHPAAQWISVLPSLSCTRLPRNVQRFSNELLRQQKDHIAPKQHFSARTYQHRSKRQCCPPSRPFNACTSEMHSRALNRPQAPKNFVRQSSICTSRSVFQQSGTHSPQQRKFNSPAIRHFAHSTPKQEPELRQSAICPNHSQLSINDRSLAPQTPPNDKTLDLPQPRSDRHLHHPTLKSVSGSRCRQQFEPSESQFSNSLAEQHSTSDALAYQTLVHNDRSVAVSHETSSLADREGKPDHTTCFLSKKHGRFEPRESAVRQGNNGKKFGVGATVWKVQQHEYRPAVAANRFKHSKSFWHQQPANSGRKRDDNYFEATPGNDSDLDLERATGDGVDREEMAYKILLPKVRLLMKELGVTDRWPQDREEKTCMVCRFPVRLKGWKALLQHAESFQKREPREHRAYFRVLTEQLKRGHKKADDLNFKGKAVLLQHGKVPEETMLWPPVVVIDNVNEKDNLDRYVTQIKPSDVQRILRFRNNVEPGLGRMLVVFPPSDIGYLNSRLLVESLLKLFTPVPSAGVHEPRSSQVSSLPPNFGGDTNTHGSIPGTCRDSAQAEGWPSQLYKEGPDPHLTQDQDNSSSCSPAPSHNPRGFLAEAADMEQMDPQGTLVRWTIEKKWGTLKGVLKKSREEYEIVKTNLKDKLLEADHIAERQKQFKFRKSLLSRKLKDAEMTFHLQLERGDQIAKQHAGKLQEIDQKFKEELRTLETERTRREGRVRRSLEENEKEVEKERDARNKEVNAMVNQLEKYQQQLQAQATKRTLEKERVITQRKAQIDEEIKLEEEQFDKNIRILEQNSMEKHNGEKITFLEVQKKIRQDILDESEITRATFKEKLQRAKQEKERLVKEAESKQVLPQGFAAECSVCFTEFNKSTERALVSPCGHARTCLPCALDVFNRNKLCPICRIEMSRRPKAIPLKLYL